MISDIKEIISDFKEILKHNLKNVVILLLVLSLLFLGWEHLNAAITFPIGGVSIVDNTDGTYLVTLADGSTITIGDTSISTLVDNGDNTYTYTDETGVATTFDVTGVLTTVTNTIVGNKIADYTDEAGGVTPINESITNFASITNGWQFTSEDGTVYPFTFTFDNSTPSAPQLLVNYGATNITITLPNALTCIGRKYEFSRYAGSTGTVTIVGTGSQIQALAGTVGATTTLGVHSVTGQGLKHSFTAINVGGVGVWVRL